MPTVVGVVTAFLITWDSLCLPRRKRIKAAAKVARAQQQNAILSYSYTVIHGSKQNANMQNAEYRISNVECGMLQAANMVI